MSRLDYYSATKYQTYEKCPLKFKYAYVDELEEEESVPMQIGTMIHHALEHHPDDQTKQEDYLKENWKLDGLDDEDQHLPHYEKCTAMLENYNLWNSNNTNKIVALEQEFTIPGDPVLKGRIDRVEKNKEGDYEVVDYKTGKRALSKNKAWLDLQIATYSMAVKEIYGEYPKQVSLVYLQINKVVTVKVDSIMIDMAKSKMLDINLKIDAKEFPAKVTPLCGWCSFKNVCSAWGGTQ